jgi:NADH-quinone oxidoreductase subunit N
MLIGLAVAPRLVPGAPGSVPGGVEALLFYLVAYGAMTVGAFAVLHHLATPERPVETVDDLAGLSRSHPGSALVMLLFLLSLIGIPLTAGFSGKFLLFWEAMGLNPPDPASIVAGPDRSKEELVKAAAEQFRLYRALAIIGALNAAIGAYYYFRMVSAMYFREAIDPLPARRPTPALGTIAVCAALTLGLAVPTPVTNYLKKALSPAAAPAQPVAEGAGKALARN